MVLRAPTTSFLVRRNDTIGAVRWNYRESYRLPSDDAIEVAKDEQS
jgi:hypothetical protein